MNRWLIGISLLLLLNACARRGSQNTNYSTEQTIQKYLAGIKQNLFLYDWVNYKAKVKIDDPKSLLKGININARLRKDSIIWMSITATSAKVEVARVLADTDSIKILQKHDSKKYYPRPFDFIETIIPAPISFEDLENILSGNPFLWNQNKCSISSPNKGEIEIKSIEGAIENISVFDNKNFKLKSVLIQNKITGQVVEINYHDYKPVDHQYLFSYQREIKLINQGDTSNYQINFNKLKLNQPLKFSFKVNNKYETL